MVLLCGYSPLQCQSQSLCSRFGPLPGIPIPYNQPRTIYPSNTIPFAYLTGNISQTHYFTPQTSYPTKLTSVVKSGILGLILDSTLLPHLFPISSQSSSFIHFILSLSISQFSLPSPFSLLLPQFKLPSLFTLTMLQIQASSHLPRISLEGYSKT